MFLTLCLLSLSLSSHVTVHHSELILPLLEAEDSGQMLLIPPSVLFCLFTPLSYFFHFSSNSTQTDCCCTIPIISFELSGFLFFWSSTILFSSTLYIRIRIMSTTLSKTNSYIWIGWTTQYQVTYTNLYKIPMAYYQFVYTNYFNYMYYQVTCTNLYKIPTRYDSVIFYWYLTIN